MELVTWGLVTLVSAFTGSYLAGYLRKKGENLATHEDVGKLVDQVRAVTTTTKEIEAKISGDVWDRQKRWELKRDVLFEATKRLWEADSALVAYAATLRVDPKPQEEIWNLEGAKRWREAKMAFEETRLLVDIVCSKETRDAFDAYSFLVGKIAVKVGENDADIYEKSRTEFAHKFLAVRNATRKELEIDRPA